MAELTQDQINQIYQARPDVAQTQTSPNQVNRWWEKFGVNELGKDFIYSASNITNPAPAPTDLLGIRNQIYTDLGVNTAQEEFNKAYKDYLNYQTGLDTQQNALENQTVSLNVIRGEQAQAQRLGAQTTAAKARGLDVLQRSLESKLGEANIQYGIRAQQVQEARQIMLEHPGAGIKLGDSMESMEGKLVKYQEEQEKKAYKKELKTMALQLGIKVTGMSAGQLEKKIRKYYKSERDYQNDIRQMEKNAKNLEMEKIQLSLKKIREASSGGGGVDFASYFGEDMTGGYTPVNQDNSFEDYYNYYGIK